MSEVPPPERGSEPKRKFFQHRLKPAKPRAPRAMRPRFDACRKCRQRWAQRAGYCVRCGKAAGIFVKHWDKDDASDRTAPKTFAQHYEEKYGCPE